MLDRQRALRILGFLAPCLAPTAQAADFGLYSRAESFTFSEPVSVYQFINDWEDDLESGQLAFTYNRFEIGFFSGGFRIGYLVRYDYRLKFSGDTARFYHEERKDQSRDQARVYRIDLDGYHQRSRGLALHYDWQPHASLRITPSLSLLQADAVVDGRLSGQIHSQGEDILSANLNADYRYERDFLLGRELEDSDFDGQGYALDLAIHWQPGDHWHLWLQTHDLFGRIHWNELPRTQARVDTEPERVEDPFQRYRQAAIQGLETERDFVQRLPTRLEAGAEFRHRRLRLRAHLYQDSGHVFWLPSIAWALGNWELGLVGETRTKALGIQIHHPRLSLGILSDSTDLKEAHLLRIQFQLHVPLYRDTL